MTAPTAKSPTVPVHLLAHALRTPLHVLEGNAMLLATGAGGGLDEVGRAVVADMRGAARSLTRVLALLDHAVAGLPPLETTGGAEVDLLPLLDRLGRAFGWAPAGDRADGLLAVPWPGFPPLLEASLAALDERAATALAVTLAPGALTLEATPFVAGSGDTALGRWLVERLAPTAGLRVELAPAGRVTWLGAFAADAPIVRRWRR
ncbi:MAG: hypothetical protein ACOC3D_04580 [Pseudomonadota bacterium]